MTNVDAKDNEVRLSYWTTAKSTERHEQVIKVNEYKLANFTNLKIGIDKNHHRSESELFLHVVGNVEDKLWKALLKFKIGQAMLLCKSRHNVVMRVSESSKLLLTSR